MKSIQFCVLAPLTPDGHGTFVGNHSTWFSLDDGFVEVPYKEVGKEMVLFESGTEGFTLVDGTSADTV